MDKKIRSIVSFAIIAFFFLAVFLFRPYYLFVSQVTGTSPIKLLLTSGEYKQHDDKTNFLLLGKAGGSYEGPNLTDSIIFTSLNLKVNKLQLVSLPRDIWSITLQDRINSAYAYGEEKKEGGGFILAKAEIEAIVGQPIDYAVLIDFERFKDVIDWLGGIKVYVERSFHDYQYPIKGKEDDPCDGDVEYKCRYQLVSFQQGWQTMDGERALKFVRSRNATGVEGTDFARGERQLKVFSALFDRVSEKLKRLNLAEIEKMYSLLDKTIERDIKNKEAAFLTKRVLLSGKITIDQTALSEDFFYVPYHNNYKGKYVLLPQDGDFSLIDRFISCLVKNKDTTSCQAIIPTRE